LIVFYSVYFLGSLLHYRSYRNTSKAYPDLSEGVMFLCLEMGSILPTRNNIFFQKKKNIKIYN
jgi:hypothetical protein